MIVTASKRYFSRLVPQLDGGFFSNFCGETSRRESASVVQTVKENTNASEWIAQKISIFVFAFDNISTPSLFWEIYGWTFQALWTSKTSCGYQKLLSIETARLFTSDDPGSCFTLACVKARESIWWRRTTKLTVTEFTILVSLIVVTKMITFKVSS